jgi:cytochrome c-type biogenesis protein CcmH
MRPHRSFLLALFAIVVIAAVWSTLLIVAPGQQTLDARTQRVASQLKCLICQGESVADSPSTLAQQMRVAIRQQLQAGRSEQDVIQYFVQRYGDQILWSPPWQGFSLLIWLVPIAFLLCGILLVFLIVRDWLAVSPESTTRLRPKNSVGTGASPVPTIAVSQNDDLERYRAQLESELATDDVLFRKPVG